MATYTEEEVTRLKERADRAEAELAALQGGEPKPAAKDEIEQQGEEGETSEGEAELRKDSTMTHLLDSLTEGKDIGHYGRLLFAMVARHFLSNEEVVGWLTRDQDFSEAKAEAMLSQVEERGYNPPKHDRILQWQKEQEFPIMPNPHDPDAGNLYRSLKFPDAVYQHIEEYKEQRQEADE